MLKIVMAKAAFSETSTKFVHCWAKLKKVEQSFSKVKKETKWNWTTFDQFYGFDCTEMNLLWPNELALLGSGTE